MIIDAAIQLRDVLSAISFGLAAAGLAFAGLSVIALRQRRRVSRLAKAPVEVEHIQKAVLHAERKQSAVLQDVLESAIADVALDQKLSPRLVRGALYAASPSDGWRVVQVVDSEYVSGAGSQSWGMQASGEGVSDAAAQRKPVVTICQRSEKNAPPVTDPDSSVSETRWTIAIPVLGADSEPVWVLSVEGAGEARDAQQLHSSVGRLVYYREILELLLKANAENL